MNDWQNLVHNVVAKFEVGAQFGQGVRFNEKGCEAMAKLIKGMAVKLDAAVANGLTTKPDEHTKGVDNPS